MCIRDSINAEYGEFTRDMGCGSSVQPQSKRERDRSRIHTSELFHLELTGAAPSHFEARSLEKVGTLQAKVAQHLGLEPRHGIFLEVVFKQTVPSSGITLKSAGFADGDSFEVTASVAMMRPGDVRGEGRVEQIQTDVADARKVDILDAAEQGLEGDVDLVCRYFPEYVNQQNSIGKTPLHFATMGNHHEMAMILLTAGADPNAAGKHGRTPLHRAATNSRKDMVGLLLEFTADPNARDKDGHTPLWWALSQTPTNKQVIQILERAGGNKL
eukprot:TRINITY_DN13975_c0_g1_i2.p1 TRINITY_DN13975_c0_g1~~TRINITY_DN13975_c0_g1_i2.p1  ORF type:complete len:271 (+),score=48.58 TRINITY_DN13975_c0_g1_i2:136-948(+)